MAVKLVIEPIFEADFADCSYGFRPKRDAHQAVGAIREALRKGHPYVFDADLSQYFDTIAHNKLLVLVARRISDRHILRWIKQWLKVVVVEVDERGMRHTMGGEKAKHGTPQGGSDLSSACQYLLASTGPSVSCILSRHRAGSPFSALCG